jgi:hypothetical protein
MRFRLGLLIGFGAGYYLGTAAGRERHEQIKSTMRKIRRSDAFETATDKAKAAADLTVERTKGFIEDHTPLGRPDLGDAGPSGTVEKNGHDAPVRV